MGTNMAGQHADTTTHGARQLAHNRQTDAAPQPRRQRLPSTLNERLENTFHILLGNARPLIGAFQPQVVAIDARQQADFAGEVLKSLKAQGIHTALDTWGQCPWDRLEKLLGHTDLLLYDLKLMDEELHREYTGLCVSQILRNLVRVREFRETTGAPAQIWIRTPIIPFHTDNAENIRAIGTYIRDTLDGMVARWELCAFNNLCAHKYDGLGIDWTCRGYGLVRAGDLERLGHTAAEALSDPGVVHISGATRYSEEES